MTESQQPLVTVITVAYNSSRYIRKAIQSVLSQSYSNIEYLISDDSSVDNTWEIIGEFKDARVRAWRNESNLGEYPNRNKCIQMARGEFIFFVDGDDIMLFRGIEDAVREMIRYPDCGFGIVNTSSVKFVGPLRISRVDAINLEFFGGGVLDSSLTNNVYRSDFIKAHLFLTQFKNADTFSRIKFLKFSPVLILYSMIAVWRLSSVQASSRIEKNHQWLELLTFYRDELFGDASFMTMEQRERIKPVYYRVFFKYILHRMKSRRLARSDKSFLLDPLLSAISFARKPVDQSFWNHYDWNNINMQLNQTRPEVVPSPQR